MMTKEEFIKLAINTEWVNRGASFDGMDCYGLVILYYRHVMGIEVDIPSGYGENKSLSECFEEGSSKWEEVDRACGDDIAFTCYNGDLPVHVGVCIDRNRVIHALGSEDDFGKVQINRLHSIRKLFGKVKFYRYKND